MVLREAKSQLPLVIDQLEANQIIQREDIFKEVVDNVPESVNHIIWKASDSAKAGIATTSIGKSHETHSFLEICCGGPEIGPLVLY
jgi:hypothetical protein